MNVFFDVDYTLISTYGTLRPWVRETFQQLVLDGHTIYVWSGVGIRWSTVKQFRLQYYVENCFEKPLERHHQRLAELKVDVVPDFCVDDYPEIIQAFGGAVIRPYYWPDPLDLEMHRVYAAISGFAPKEGAGARRGPAAAP